MSRAIITKYVGATDTEGSRFVASIEDIASGPYSWTRIADPNMRVTVAYDHGLEASANHLRAAQELADRLGWGGDWYGGTLEDGRYVWVRRDGQNGFSAKSLEHPPDRRDR
jgi:hypothetical protein